MLKDRKKVVILGASGHGSVVLDIIEKEGVYEVAGFLDSYKEKGTIVYGYEVLGSEKDVPRLMAELGITGGIVAIGDNWVRRKIANKIRAIAPTFEFVYAIHPSASLGRGVEIGEGTVIMPGVVVNANSQIGNHCVLNTKSSLGHDGLMADYSSLAPGVFSGGNLRLGMCTSVGIGTNILESTTIGSHCVVGAGSLVLQKYLPDNSIAFGVPCKIIRKREADEPYLSGFNHRGVPFFSGEG